MTNIESENQWDLSAEAKERIVEKYLKRYIDERKNGNWSTYRDKSSRFEIQQKEIKFIGNKRIYLPNESDYNLNLQESRGLGIDEDTTIEKIIRSSSEKIVSMEESDNVRSKELDKFLNSHFDKTSGKNFLEIGFRIPKLQYYYRNNFSMNDYGVDINSFNVEIFSEMGFNCSTFNLIENKSIQDEIGTTFDVVVCYHVLEHVTNPVESIENIFNSMNKGGVFHVEVPIEPGTPRLEYGHLISYDPGDMLKILRGVGFNVVSGNNDTHTGGPWIERYIAVK